MGSMVRRIEVTACVIGAGPVGATLAATLAAGGIETAVVDAAPLPPMELPEFDGRAYAVAASSRNLLRAAGVWDRLPSVPGPIREIHVSDGRPGEPASRLDLHFSADDLGAEAFGWMVEARSLRVALNAALPGLPRLAVFAPARAAVERTPAGALVRLEDGTEIAARLVVGAEGRRSPTRRQAGIGTTELDYRQDGIVLAIAHERPHGEAALEHFLPNGPFAQLPLAPTAEHPHASAIVWTEGRALARRFLAMDDAALGREVARRLGGRLGAVRVIGRRWSYPLGAMRTDRLVAERLALVGDAAHGIHPIAGQGLNLGFRDVAALAECVIETVNGGGDPGGPAALSRYQRARQGEVLAMLGATHVLERLFGNDAAPLRLARRLGIAAVDRTPALKRFFAERAMGLGGGTLSGLLQGRGLLAGR